MTKKLLLFTFISCFGIANAQNIELRMHKGTALINETMITVIDTVGVSPNQDVAVEIDVTSTYTATKTIKVKKIEKTSNAPLSENAICWGVCTLGTVWAASPVVISEAIPMNASQKVLYSGHLYPKMQGGNSVFRYVWFDVNNTNDSTWVDVTYEIRGYSSLDEMKKNTTLNIFPNPARELVKISLSSKANNKIVTITDMLGRKVYTKTSANNNETMAVNTSVFKPGVYFVSVTSDNQVLKTEKLIVTN